MGLKRKLNKAVKPVHLEDAREDDYRRRKEPLPTLHAEEIGEIDPNGIEGRNATEYTNITVTGSGGKKYRVVVPKSYASSVPKVWKWTPDKYDIAEAIALGIPIQNIVDDPQYKVRTRLTIYAWLEHPEFREHVDGLTLEAGFANKRERIAGMNRLTKMLFDKVVKELDGVKLTDKSLGAVLSSIAANMKHLAQEKEEFIESSKVEQQTTLNGTVGVAHLSIDNMLNNKTVDERKELEKEFASVADDIIRQITGE